MDPDPGHEHLLNRRKNFRLFFFLFSVIFMLKLYEPFREWHFWQSFFFNRFGFWAEKIFAPVFGWYFAPWIRIRGSAYFSGSGHGSGSRKPIWCRFNGSGSQAPLFLQEMYFTVDLHKKMDFLIICFSCFVWLWTHGDKRKLLYSTIFLSLIYFILVYTISNPVGNSKAPAILHKWNSQSYTVENQVKRWK